MGGPFWVSRDQSGWPLGVGRLCQLKTQLAQDIWSHPLYFANGPTKPRDDNALTNVTQQVDSKILSLVTAPTTGEMWK